MPQVKIVLVQKLDYDFDDNYESFSILRDSISDWEEITQQELDLLTYNPQFLNKACGVKNNYKAIIVVKDIEPVFNRIQSVKNYLKALEEDVRKSNEKAELARKERERKKALKKMSEKQLYEELKRKFEND